MLESSKIFLDTTKNVKPEVAIILGSGLTNFFAEQDILYTIPYNNLPDFPQPTVEGHQGKLILGEMSFETFIMMYHIMNFIIEWYKWNHIKN